MNVSRQQQLGAPHVEAMPRRPACHRYIETPLTFIALAPVKATTVAEMGQQITESIPRPLKRVITRESWHPVFMPMILHYIGSQTGNCTSQQDCADVIK